MSWYLVAALAALKAELNELAPGRDKTSDGTIGDAAHQKEPSDHNPDSAGRVHAIDVDDTGPWPDGWSAERIVQFLVARQRSGADDRLQNVIYNRRIWSRSWGWAGEPYAGASPHTEHIHLSARHDSTRDHTQPWGILAAHQKENDMAVTDEDAKKIASAVVAQSLGASGPTVGVALQSGYGLIQALILMARAEAAEVPPSVAQIVDGVEAAFAAGTPTETADALRVVLGDNAAEVGRLLAAG
jgi:hypothetical protein